jgi:hypothetical protein
MPRRWIVNPEVDLLSKCESVGRFLKSDYKMAIRNADIPDEFEDNLEPSGRKFVIIGAKSVPLATAKSVFLCLRLSGAESIAIKAPTEDEAWLIKNVLDNWTPEGTTAKIFSIGSTQLKELPEWNRYIEEATDLVVFGGEDTAEAFSEFETENRRVFIHGPKFSFGVINSNDLNMTRLRDICSDFGAYYGEGCLSPKFYVIVGAMEDSWLHEASLIMRANHGEDIEEFRSKLPLGKKSEVVQSLASANVVYKYVRLEELDDRKIFSPLYGESRFVVVDSLDDLKDFMDKWKTSISSVACLEEDEEIMSFMDDFDVVRTCHFGTMQFPNFEEQFDVVDDFDIYCS